MTNDILTYELIKLNEHIIIDGYDDVICNKLLITIIKKNSNRVEFKIDFDLDIKEDLPIYMNNMIGILMSKLFYNIKLFIEKIKY